MGLLHRLKRVGGIITQVEHRRARFEDEAMPHVRALLRTAARLCRNLEAAEDLVQETMLRAWKSFEQYQPQTNCKAWLFAILMNLRNEQKRRRCVRDEMTAQDESLFDEPGVPSKSDDQVFLHEVMVCINRLPEEQRCALLLSVVEDLPLREIAEILKVPMGTVMSRLGRARSALRQYLYPCPAPARSDREPRQCDAMKLKGC